MKRILFLLAGYALYRWWTNPPAQPAGPPIALPPPRKHPAKRRKAAERQASN